jgi:hypothetical protein
MNSERLLGLALLLVACRPDFGLPVSVITEPRLLVAESSPPEAAPGAAVHLTVVGAGPEGALEATATFGFCTSPRPLVESNVVNADCLGASPAMSLIASGVLETDATLPTNACLQFGPDTPPQKAGEPPFRPRDPDVTGGYYQPVHVTLGADLEGIALVRIRCNLPGASAQRAAEFGQRYSNNTNPALEHFELRVGGAVVDPQAVPANAKVTLYASWAAEAFVVHERSTDTLVDHREALRVSWFTTGGVIPIVATGRAEDDLATETETTWETPASGQGVL